MVETQVTQIKTSKIRAMPKKKTNPMRVLFDSLESSVTKSKAVASTADEEMWEEPALRPEEGGSLGVQAKALIELAVVAQVGGTVIDAPEIPSPPPLEEEVRPKVKKKVLKEEPKELVVSFLDFLQDSIVSLLKYLDRKREKYAVSKEAGLYVELVRNSTRIKRAVAMKRKWKSATTRTKERVASLPSECATMKAKEKECRAEEKQKAEGLWRHIDALKTKRLELRKRIGKRTEAHIRELQCANELMASLAEQLRKHAAELVDWAKILTDVGSARSSKFECRVRFEADCGRLQGRLKLVMEQ
ncbi:hypothetical protein AXG93_1800s1010 [Marchantia polymorpha subsp. ruderalis]|uniref:Uncharacterized protein n=1 Tax=Marchantia polymorpha subsp. ruderalis TaxID=1480154 RepID=A0A176VVB7_MARPO|nr:hypothetical protein AXG93_1800s1010 [Marchantia polymorpha subsp. ruderalis]